MKKTMQVYPLNRVEGDLEIHLAVEDGVVTDARSVGTMFRGFENLLAGRAPLDSLVITPRICGICSTAHLTAAAMALDMALEVEVPANAKRVRNATLMVEQLQNDIRHTFLMFMPDFTRPEYRSDPLYEEIVDRYTPLKGSSALQSIRETKKILEIIAILGGQWPHSSFMVPGGVVSRPSATDINQCRSLLVGFRHWYEKRIIGCSLERWHAVRCLADLDDWLQENDRQRESDLGLFVRFARRNGMDRLGRGCGNLVCFGSLDMPPGTAAKALGDGGTFFPPGVIQGDARLPFSQEDVSEEIACTFMEGYTGAKHPFDGVTIPSRSALASDERYSWAKAPRYDGRPAETGPLAELAVARHPLIVDLLERLGPSVFTRQLARIIRPAVIMQPLDCWLAEINASGDAFFRNYRLPEYGTGFGLVEAHRGALGHWLQIVDGRIDHYQIITPSAWNFSPRDGAGRRGPLEQALVGTPATDDCQPVAAEHVVRSFDPCLVCTVHAVDLRRSRLPRQASAARRRLGSGNLKGG